jgi:hypothetical protein
MGIEMLGASAANALCDDAHCSGPTVEPLITTMQ